MGDEMNHVRAMRLAEIIQEFRVLQHYLSQIEVPLNVEEDSAKGYTILQECYREGQDVLNAPPPESNKSPNGDVEKEKAQLQQVMLDAASRRFQAQRICLKATAAMRWINARNALADPSNVAELQAVDRDLERELRNITDEKIHEEMLLNDQRQGKWVDEDPDLSSIQNHLAASP